MINDLVDKVFVINTKEAVDRMGEISDQLNKLDISYERIESVPIEGLSTDRDLPDFFIDKTDKELEGWNVYAKSLQETTKNILKRSLEEGYEKILILEDDANFNMDRYSSGVSNIKNFMDQNNSWDFLNLNYLCVSRFSFTPYNGIFWMKNGCLCCQAYIIHKNVMEEYLNELNRLNFTIDDIAMRLHMKRRRSFCVNPKIIDHPPNKFSTI